MGCRVPGAGCNAVVLGVCMTRTTAAACAATGAIQAPFRLARLRARVLAVSESYLARRHDKFALTFSRLCAYANMQEKGNRTEWS